jgi:hypothetical protein
MPSKIVKEYLKCILTEDEKKAISDRMALTILTISEKEDQLKSVSKQIKGEIARCELDLNGYAEKTRSGYEMRNVECKEIINFDDGTFTKVRLDTGELIVERNLTMEEKQQRLPGVN